MPYVNSIITKKVSQSVKDMLKVHIGDLINDIPGKSEEWLMVHFNDDETLYFKGEKMTEAAIVEVKILGEVDIKHKDSFTYKISAILGQELNIPKENIYVIFQEIPDGSWGWNGELF